MMELGAYLLDEVQHMATYTCWDDKDIFTISVRSSLEAAAGYVL